MREWPESRLVAELLTRVTRRRIVEALITSVAVGLGAGAVCALALLLGGATASVGALTIAAFALVGAAVAWLRLDTSAAAAAAAVEARAPHCQNVIVTAAALLKDAGPTPVAICRVVLHDAAQVGRRIDPSVLWPRARPVGRLVAALVLGATVFLAKVPGAAAFLPDLTTEASASPVVSEVHVTVTSPSYAELATETLADPERVVALSGSRLELRIAATGTRMLVETADGASSVERGADSWFATGVTVIADGFIAITPEDADGNAGPRRLIGVTATPDRPPVPRVTLPGKDLFLREATEALALAVEATDDLGLRSLALAYTKVAGVGESFTFTEGTVPLVLTRTSGRQWNGTGALPLGGLQLDVGDMVVYRAVATDARPGAVPVESDAFIVEIVSASEAMAEGFAIDDTQDKYALSQQMVILKTERLIAKTKAAPAPDVETVRDEAMTIAAEQRSVRGELVFMTGGHFEDEFVEAAHEHEVADGRFDNTGRADLARAIRDMSRASSELMDGSLQTALEAEKAALEAMQRALSRRRFILRTLTERESIDDTRRLAGTLSDLARTRRAAADPDVPPHVVALREGLAAIGDIAGAQMLTPDHANALTDVAGALLRVGGGNASVIDIVSVVSAAGEAVVGGREREARAALADAAARITSMLRAAAPASAPMPDMDRRRLLGALADVRRGGGGR